MSTLHETFLTVLISTSQKLHSLGFGGRGGGGIKLDIPVIYSMTSGYIFDMLEYEE